MVFHPKDSDMIGVLACYTQQIFFSFLFFLLPIEMIQTCLRHPECTSSRENRDTVFCHMRRAIDLVHYVVKDGILQTSADHHGPGGGASINNDVRSAATSNSSASNQRSKEVL